LSARIDHFVREPYRDPLFPEGGEELFEEFLEVPAGVGAGQAGAVLVSGVPPGDLEDGIHVEQ
jgi:hypothetical protein